MCFIISYFIQKFRLQNYNFFPTRITVTYHLVSNHRSINSCLYPFPHSCMASLYTAADVPLRGTLM